MGVRRGDAGQQQRQPSWRRGRVLDGAVCASRFSRARMGRSLAGGLPARPGHARPLPGGTHPQQRPYCRGQAHGSGCVPRCPWQGRARRRGSRSPDMGLFRAAVVYVMPCARACVHHRCMQRGAAPPPRTYAGTIERRSNRCKLRPLRALVGRGRDGSSHRRSGERCGRQPSGGTQPGGGPGWVVAFEQVLTVRSKHPRHPPIVAPQTDSSAGRAA